MHNPRRAAALALVHGPRQAPRAAHNYGEHPLGTPRRVQDFCHVCLIFAPAPTAHKCWCSGFGRCMPHADLAKIGRRACDLPPVLPDPLRPRATISRSPPNYPALCAAADAGERVSNEGETLRPDVVRSSLLIVHHSQPHGRAGRTASRQLGAISLISPHLPLRPPPHRPGTQVAGGRGGTDWSLSVAGDASGSTGLEGGAWARSAPPPRPPAPARAPPGALTHTGAGRAPRAPVEHLPDRI